MIGDCAMRFPVVAAVVLLIAQVSGTEMGMAEPRRMGPVPGPVLASAEEGGGDPPRTAKLSFHGYGEFHYNNPRLGTMDRGEGARADVHRFVLGWSYEYTNAIRIDAEIDFEHAASEIELEYAQIEFDVSDYLSVRLGSLLMPVGPLNEFHEPPNFYSVERPYVESAVIPTTWQEIGVGVGGQVLEGNLAYRAYVVTGLDAKAFNSLDGLRGGRSKGSEAEAEDIAFAGRLEYYPPIGGLSLGGSVYGGGASQGNGALGDAGVFLYEFDGRYRAAGFDLRGEFVRVGVEDADQINAFIGGPATVGETIQGWNAEVGYNIFEHVFQGVRQELVAFARREEFDTNESVPSGYLKNPAADRAVWTFGMAYFPDRKIALKADVELWEDGANASLTRYNLGAGFMF